MLQRKADKNNLTQKGEYPLVELLLLVIISSYVDSSEIERRQLAMEAHRRKLQEEHDRKAAEHAARQAEVCFV